MECSDARSSLCLAGGQRQASFDADRMAVRHPGAAALQPPPSGAGIRGRSPGHGPPAHPRSLPSPPTKTVRSCSANVAGASRASISSLRMCKVRQRSIARLCHRRRHHARACKWSDWVVRSVRRQVDGPRQPSATLVFWHVFIKRPILTEWQRSMQLWPVRRQAVVPLFPAISGPACRQHVLSSLTSFRYIAHAEAE